MSEKTNYANLLLGDKKVRELLTRVDQLSKGSPYQKEAIECSVEAALRKAYGLNYSENTQNITALCKAELEAKLPGLTKQELEDFARARNKVANEVAQELVDRTKMVMDAFFTELEQHVLVKAEKQIKEFEERKIDDLIEAQLTRRPPSFQKAVLLNDLYGKTTLHASDLKKIERIFKQEKNNGGAQ